MNPTNVPVPPLSESAAGGPHSPTSRIRDVRLDNLKGVLIALVVLGHFIEPFRHRFDWTGDLYEFIYLFHMPMFAYASGVVSRPDLTADGCRGILDKLVLPYFSLYAISVIFEHVVFAPPNLTFSPSVPFWTLWYFMSLIWWRILIGLFSQLRYPLGFAIVAALAVGFNRYEANLSFSRTFVYFPFFVLGSRYHRSITLCLGRLPRLAVLSCALLIGSFIAVSQVIPDDINIRWFYGSNSYAELGVSSYMGMIYRIGLLCAGLITGVTVLACVPKTRTPLAHIGMHSVAIYILHPFVLKICKRMELFGMIKDEYDAVMVVALAILLVPALASKPGRVLATRLMHPLPWLHELLVPRAPVATEIAAPLERAIGSAPGALQRVGN